MKRLAAHYICFDQVYTLSYLQIEDNKQPLIFKLTEEIASTSFFNGLLIVVPFSETEPIKTKLKELSSEKNTLKEIAESACSLQWIKGITKECKYTILQLESLSASPTKLGTYNCRCNSNI